MNANEKKVIRHNFDYLMKNLIPLEITGILFQENLLSREQFEELDEIQRTTSHKCKRLLLFITAEDSRCTFGGFLKALRHKGVFSFVADKLESDLIADDGNIEETTQGNQDKYSDDENKGKTNDIILETVRKIETHTSTKRRMTMFSHKLKKLPHDGHLEQFHDLRVAIERKYKKFKLDANRPILKRMELADMMFVSLDIGIEAKRLQYQTELGSGDVFEQMQAVIPYTSDPVLSSMTFCARFGSAVSMTTTLDEGLAHLQFAKQHAERVVPGKDTGMVFYIETNLLFQKYAHSPTETLKGELLNTIDKGISQFNEENEGIRRDYLRMFLIKMVYCRLGLGLFGERLENVETTEEDIKTAKGAIDFIESGEIWDGMEKRRMMLFLVGKAEYHRRDGNIDLAMVHATEAEKLARENNWSKELPNISELISELTASPNNKREQYEIQKADQGVGEMIQELLGDDYCEDDPT
ncbi:uncharacterized protein LOC128246804 [Mya arenaria]|uniref:uncharacterized protein LOC128246804 n=1 Tax=Mya arenaria TaxID=6604 RepID=UPI0022E84256|nr:uncharacterized protein LOC128246804 [Mya arenaria]